MLEVMKTGLASGLRHFLLGSTERTLNLLQAGLGEKLPGVRLCGAHSPPFAPVDAMNIESIVTLIKEATPDVVWLGLGMPKQELLMERLRSFLPGVALVGVGAAFDFHAGTIAQAPAWMQSRGLEWAFRFSQEPRRLAGRYLWNNPAFLGRFLLEYMKRPRRER
jgi:N-acetylglucosaminyldiphosphoundecaprenol N-acetyl-beta-D-mannosaminyltransferase